MSTLLKYKGFFVLKSQIWRVKPADMETKEVKTKDGVAPGHLLKIRPQGRLLLVLRITLTLLFVTSKLLFIRTHLGYSHGWGLG